MNSPSSQWCTAPLRKNARHSAANAAHCCRAVRRGRPLAKAALDAATTWLLVGSAYCLLRWVMVPAEGLGVAVEAEVGQAALGGAVPLGAGVRGARNATRGS